MVEVFKTNIEKRKNAKRVLMLLSQRFPNYRINFDLEDCDNILRVENPEGKIVGDPIIVSIVGMGYSIEPLPDVVPINNLST